MQDTGVVIGALVIDNGYRCHSEIEIVTDI